MVQNYFFPNIPDKGFLVDFFSFSSWTLITSILLILNYVERFLGIFFKAIFSLQKFLLCIYCQIKRLVTIDFWSFSSFGRVIPDFHTLQGSNSFLTDNTCIKRCYKSNIYDLGWLVNFMSEKFEAVYMLTIVQTVIL